MKRLLCFRASSAMGILSAALVVFGFSPTARAHYSETIKSLALTNFVGWVVDSDANNPNAGYERDGLNVNASIRYTTTNSTLTAYQYQLAFRLLDSQNNPVPLTVAPGVTNSALLVTNTVFLPSILVPRSPARSPFTASSSSPRRTSART